MTNTSELDIILDSKSGPLSFSPTRETPHDYIERLKEFFSSKEQKAAIDLLEKTAIASWGATDLIADSKSYKPQANPEKYEKYFKILEARDEYKTRMVEMQRGPLNDLKRTFNLSKHFLEQEFPKDYSLNRVLDKTANGILKAVNEPYEPVDIASLVFLLENVLITHLGFDEDMPSQLRNAARVELGLKPLDLFPKATAKL